MAKTTLEQVKDSISLYSKLFLRVYDSVALGWNCRFIWRCPSFYMLEMYHKHVSANHLDIGVGTGYFMAHCRFPNVKPRLALMDLSANSLRAAGKRLARYNPEIYQRNVLEPFNIDGARFDSIGMMNLLHCLPGDMKSKGIVFEFARELMNPGAVLFGSTILYRGVKRSPMTTLVLKMTNRRGFMHNMEDDVVGLKDALQHYFSESSIRIIGCEALFWAKD